MKCQYLVSSNEGRRIECKAATTRGCQKSRGQFRVTQYCWGIKKESKNETQT